mmetsp:Transcript_6522/g.20548  ORF Transcript_6522/g.20548 Transcript_6522/m.20548 type:complete len:207 (-) Transcript_6522:127-747(-)
MFSAPGAVWHAASADANDAAAAGGRSSPHASASSPNKSQAFSLAHMAWRSTVMRWPAMTIEYVPAASRCNSSSPALASCWTFGAAVAAANNGAATASSALPRWRAPHVATTRTAAGRSVESARSSTPSSSGLPCGFAADNTAGAAASATIACKIAGASPRKRSPPTAAPTRAAHSIARARICATTSCSFEPSVCASAAASNGMSVA